MSVATRPARPASIATSTSTTPATAMRSRLPPVSPMTVPARRLPLPAAAPRSRCPATPTRQRATRTPRTARRHVDRAPFDTDTPSTDTSAPMPPVPNSTPPASPPGRRPSSRAPSARRAARPARRAGSAAPARPARSSDGRHAAHQLVHHLQVLAAAEFAAAFAEQHDDVARLPERRRHHASTFSSRPTTPTTGVG